jgi:hypothetical protein
MKTSMAMANEILSAQELSPHRMSHKKRENLPARTGNTIHGHIATEFAAGDRVL